MTLEETIHLIRAHGSDLACFDRRTKKSVKIAKWTAQRILDLLDSVERMEKHQKKSGTD